MSPSLRSLQDDLLALLLDEASPDSAARVAAGSARLTPSEQVAIYREQIRERHRASLRHDFPALALLLGDPLFDALARAYLAQHPPTSYTLRDLGARLPSVVVPLLLALHLPRSFAHLAHDLARLEWTAVEASDAPDAPPLDRALLASLSPEQLDASTLHFAPSLALLSLAHAVHTLPSDDSTPSHLLAPSPTFLAVARRPDHDLAVVELSPLEHGALSRLLTGLPLAVALDDLALSLDADSVAQLGASLGPWFAAWVERGWLCSLATP